MWRPEFRRIGNIFDPLREMQRLHTEMDRLFSGVTLPFTQSFPAINIWTGDHDTVVTSEVPGIDPKDIDISVEGDTLTISGSRMPEELKEGDTYHRQERGHGRFARTVKLPFRVEPGKVEAKYDKGILTVTLPRLEEDKPKKIQIKSA